MNFQEACLYKEFVNLSPSEAIARLRSKYRSQLANAQDGTTTINCKRCGKGRIVDIYRNNKGAAMAGTEWEQCEKS